LSDGKYDTGFPHENSSEELEEIAEAVKLVSSTATYERFVFSEDSQIEPSHIDSLIIQRSAIRREIFTKSTSGSAAILHHKDKRIALLTCAHVVSLPDTILTHYESQGEERAVYARSISFKKEQANVVSGLPESGDVEILVMDKRSDIAFLGKELSKKAGQRVPVFGYRLGSAKELEWGTFVFVIGYPMGYKMVTRGIVSSPNRDKAGSFLLDAVFNRGFSGGIILAVRDGVPNFELVGLARSVPVRFEYVLTPGKKISDLGYDPDAPYEGSVYAELRRDLKYGITHAISVDAVRKCLQQNEAHFLEKGYDLRGLLEPG
jgi:hypothetical protein